MIADVVHMAQGYDAQMPPELRTAFDVRRWGTLPEAGGLYDQSARLMYRMSLFDNVYKAVSKVTQLVGDQIHSLNTSERLILRYLREEGLL